MKKTLLTMMMILCLAGLAQAQELKVVLEPFPPFVNEDGSGIVPTLLEKIQGETGYTFAIETMPYNRARQMLMDGKAHILGIVAQGLEAPDFYEKCQDLEWGFPTMSDLYATDPAAFGSLEGKVVGTPDGNEGLASEVLGIDMASIQGAQLENLFKMLERGRLDLVWFARDASMSTFKDLGMSFHYQAMPPEPVMASLATANTPEGQAIAAAISKALSAFDLESMFPDYAERTNLPLEGVYP